MPGGYHVTSGDLLIIVYIVALSTMTLFRSTLMTMSRVLMMEFHWLMMQDGWTPLHAAAKSASVDVVRVLLAAGAYVDATTHVRMLAPPCTKVLFRP